MHSGRNRWVRALLHDGALLSGQPRGVEICLTHHIGAPNSGAVSNARSCAWARITATSSRKRATSSRSTDLDAIAALGIRTLRYPVLWETVSPESPDQCDWRFTDERLGRLRDLAITPIAGLLHHGSGPRYTNMMDDAFPQLLAHHAENAARRYPWLDMYTPVNEPLTTARFSGLYGHWYPHRHDIASFLRCLVNECLGTLLAMRAIRTVNPAAKLVQTEDLGKVFSTPRLAYQAEYENQRRWLSLDLLDGPGGHAHIPGTRTSLATASRRRNSRCFSEVRQHRTSSASTTMPRASATWTRRCSSTPPASTAAISRSAMRMSRRCAIDLPENETGARARLMEVWDRYRLPIAVTEVHHGSTREEQLRWLAEVWEDANAALRAGADIRAVTVWSLFGAMDWNTLLTERHGFYEPGAFDVRGEKPRLTAIGKAVQEIAAGRRPSHPVLEREGWWRREGRFYHPPARSAPALLPPPAHAPCRRGGWPARVRDPAPLRRART